jgi:flagellar basal body-associated protein FliL
MSTKRILLLIFGGLLILVSVIAILAGGAMVWASQYHKDSEGFHVTDSMDVRSASYAIISDTIEIDRGASAALDWLGMDTVKVEVENDNSSQAVFIGVADTDDIRDYLDDVEHDEVTDLDVFPSRLRYKTQRGDSEPGLPGTQDFWIETSEGTGAQVVKFDLEEGEYTIVAMNADGSAGIDMDVIFGIRSSGVFLAIGIIFILLGIGLMTGGIIMVVFGAKSPREQQQRIPPPPPPPVQ